MKALLFTIAFFHCFTFLLGQSPSIKVKIYDAQIILIEGKLDQRVNLFELTDSAIFITNTSLLKSEIQHYDYSTNRILFPENIKLIKARQKGSVGKGLMYGAVSGVIIGTLLGASWTDTDQGNVGYSILIGIGFSIMPTTLIGGALGSINRKFHINQNYNTYQQLRPELEKYTINNLTSE